MIHVCSIFAIHCQLLLYPLPSCTCTAPLPLLSSFPMLCLFVALIGRQRVSLATLTGLTATETWPWQSEPLPPSLPCHSHPTKALGSFHSCQPSSVHTLSRPPLGEDDRVVVLVSGRLVEPAAPVSGLHWEATPPDTRARLPASRGREEGQPPTGVPTPTHQPTKLPTPTHHYPTQHHLTTISSITIRFNSIPPKQ